MHRYKRILVGLSLSDKSAATLQYAGLVSRLAQSEVVYFAHVEPTLDLPDEIRREHPELVIPVDERLEEQMSLLVEKHFRGHPATRKEYLIDEGGPLLEILRWTRRKEIDLVIVGKKGRSKRPARIPEKLARKAPCSVLVVPHGFPETLSRILVATDFSDASADALDIGIAFGAAAGLPEIVCGHVYNVPTGYHKTGKSHQQFAKIMLRNAEVRAGDFLARIDSRGLELIPRFQLGKRSAETIEKMTVEVGADLLVVGARGRAALAGVLLGSVTEQLIARARIPLVAVKKKGAGMSVLDALLEL
jgi:nucleotide-binding universal stress UspA family protein